jgi:hypothetical protein
MSKGLCNAIYYRLATGLLIGIPFCAVPASASERSLTLLSNANQVRAYEKLEFHIEAPTTYTNPFDPDEVELNVRFATPGEKPLLVPAFLYQHYERAALFSPDQRRDWFYPIGLPGWRVRFAPLRTGRYEAVAALKDRWGTVSSAPVMFDCVGVASPGFVRVSRTDSRFLEFSEGQPFFPIGQNLAFIGTQQYVTLSRMEQIFGKLAENGANYLRIWTCCEDWAMAIEARKSAWGRSWDWRPPLTPMPGADNPARKCLTLTPSKSNLRVEPSHPVALRPSTRYAFAARIRTTPTAKVRVTLNNTRIEKVFSQENWASVREEFQTGADQRWLGETSLSLEGDGQAWVDAFSLREAAGGPELLWEADVNRPILGYYNPVDCWMLDRVVAAAETNHLYLQLCLLTRDLYMDKLKDPASLEYERAIASAKKTFRYAIARWGYSTAVAAWEYWNEMNPGLPTDRFYSELGEYLEKLDPCRHLRRTSTWGPSPKDCRHPKLDVADVHFYLRPADKGKIDDEVHAVLERTKWLREQAAAKPAQLGEFGLADDKWAITEEMKRSPELADAHSALWASALSGASGTAMFWWWERLDQRDFYPHYKPLSRFIADVPWNSGQVQAAEVSAEEPRVRVLGLRARDRVWLWLYNRESAWANMVSAGRTPSSLEDVHLLIQGLAPGPFTVRWLDTRSGSVLREQTATAAADGLRVSAPAFARDIAAAILPETR